MCGILGYVTLDRPEDRRNWMVRSIGALAHRGPDDEGVWSGVDGRVGLAHRRLAIIDTSENGHQPMHSRDGAVVLVFNGHVYNFVEVRAELERHGVAFSTATDTEVFLEAYRFWGRQFVDRLHGFFAFALWNDRTKRLLLGRDRLGEKPLYFSRSPRCVTFASEPRVLDKTGLEATSVADYVVFGFVPAPKTMWRDVFKLEPGHLLEIDAGVGELSVRKHRYWRPRIGETDLVREDDMIAGLEHHCMEAAARTTRSDVPLGCLLSGGVDSSGVVAMISRSGRKPIDTYTVGFGSTDGDELPWARRVAQRYGARHREIVCSGEDVEESFPRMRQIYGEPFDDDSQVPCTAVFREASRYCKVVLTGDGGDEVFCGYTKFSKLRRLLLARSPFPRWLWQRVLTKVHSRVESGSWIENQLYRALSPDDELLCELSALAARPREIAELLTLDLADYDPRVHIRSRLRDVEHDDPLDQLRYLDMTFKLPEQMLFKVDRASMAASLESRAFYLYQPLLEFSLSLPTRVLVRRGGKYLLKRMLEPYVPSENMYRRKRGFGMQRVRYRDWVSQEMLAYLRDEAGVDYATVLGRANPVKGKRLHFGARSLYEWRKSNPADAQPGRA